MSPDNTTVMTVEVVVVDVSMVHVEEAMTDVKEEAMIAVEMIGGVRREAKNY
jgi:hypothetical protein